MDMDLPEGPIDVGGSQLADVAGAQAQPGEKKNDGAVSNADWSDCVAGGNDALDQRLTCVPRKCREAPSPHGGHRLHKFRAAFALGYEEAEKGAQNRRRKLYRRTRALRVLF
jgi:hypothetical protein